MEVDARLADMRNLDVGVVDGASAFGNSLGYFGLEGTRRFVAALARSLRSGGRLVLDTSALAEVLFAGFETESTLDAGGITMSDRNRYDPRSSRIDTTVTFERDGESTSRDMSVWVLTSAQLVEVLEGAGFEVEALPAGSTKRPSTSERAAFW